MKYNFESIEWALERLRDGRHRYEDGEIISSRTGNPLGFKSGKGGYLGYNVMKKSVFIHRVVFAYFHGIEELKKHEVIDHIDGNKYNNRIENLRGLSNAKNVYLAKQRVRKGNKLSFCQVKEIKKRLARGDMQKDIAADFNVTPPSISDIKLGKCFSYL